MKLWTREEMINNVVSFNVDNPTNMTLSFFLDSLNYRKHKKNTSRLKNYNYDNRTKYIKF